MQFRWHGLGRSIWATALVIGVAAVLPGTGSAAESCSSGWQVDTLVAGLGGLENLEPDGKGGFYLAGNDAGVIYHVDPARTVRIVAKNLDSPAGMRISGNTLYFLTGDSTSANLLLQPNGTLRKLDLGNGRITTLLTGLTAPNGLLLLPDGDLLISRSTLYGPRAGLARYRPATKRFTPLWAKVPRSNGIAITPDRKAVYTDDDVSHRIYRVPLDAPDSWKAVAQVDPLSAPDDMQTTKDGTVYLAGNGAGKLFKLNMATGASCTIASGILTPHYPPGPSSVRIAPDGKHWALYAVSADGALRRLRPPAGVDLTPA